MGVSAYPMRGKAVMGVNARKNKRYAEGRVCGAVDKGGACETVLSVYNARGTCWVHTPVEQRSQHRGRRVKQSA